MPSFRPGLETGDFVSKLETWHPYSVASTSTEHFNFVEPEHVLEHLTLEHRARALST